jgi:iron(III) transport system ATP-binding protein
MASVRLDQISMRFGSTIALEEIHLQINSGEMFFLLGPSGCGKSTLLRIIAGLHEPTRGRVYFDDRDVTSLPTERRNAVMCFQSYALWPHMSVRDNVRFGLTVRNIPANQQNRRLSEVLKLVQMENFAGRRPNQLSGGQQQRVALARAIAVNPECLLLDEPLSNLDAKLRLEMRSEIRRICKESGLTTVYVTHDQKEALSIADRIALLKDGRLVQVGAPAELYHRPRTGFVADFIGQANLFSGSVIGRGAGGIVRLKTPLGQIVANVDHQVPDEVKVSIRPEQIHISRDPQTDGKNVISGRPIATTFLGEASEHTLLVNEDQPVRFIATPPLFTVPPQLSIEFDPRDVVLLAE